MTLPPDLAALGDEKFVSLTTFRKSGAAVPTTVWVGRDGDSLVVTTPSGSGKVKRLRHDERISLRPSSRRGSIDTSVPPVAGVAEVVEGREAMDRLDRADGRQVPPRVPPRDGDRATDPSRRSPAGDAAHHGRGRGRLTPAQSSA